MKKKQIWVIPGIILTLISLACSLPISITFGSEPTPLPQPTQASVDEPVAAPTEEAPIIPETGQTGIPAPVAILTDPGDLKGANLYGVDGTFLAELILGEDLWLNLDTIAIGSDLAPVPSETHLIFYDFSSASLKKYSGPDNFSVLASIPTLLKIITEPYTSVFVFSTINMQANGTQNDLYWTDINSFNAPIHEISELESRGYGISPLGVRPGEGNIDIWYTHVPYGIGGDIVFPPYSGLHRYRTGGDYNDVILDDEARPVGLSASKLWIAYTTPQAELSTLYIQNLENTENHQITLRSDSNRGAGYVEFSPRDTYFAWMEGSGWMMAETPDFNSTIRVASIKGELLAERAANDFGMAAGIESNWAKPVAWLDDQTLLVQVHGLEWTNSAIIKWNISENTLQFLIPGIFIDFVYPPQ